MRLNEEEDMLVWDWNCVTWQVNVKDNYAGISQMNYEGDSKWWHKRLWKWCIPMRIKCFYWPCLENYILKWGNLVRRGWWSPSYCILWKTCKSISHIFLHYTLCKSIWYIILVLYIFQKIGKITQLMSISQLGGFSKFP